jgi:diguanylate cyclase (GGDEF)-like protein
MSVKHHQSLALSRVIRLHYLPAALALVAMAMVVFFVDWQMRRSDERDMRQQVSTDLDRIRTRLESSIHGSVKLVQGYVAALETEPDMNQQRYTELGDRILREDSIIRSVAAAENFAVTLIYPIKGNERVLGLNYKLTPSQRDAAMKVRETGQMLLTGPVKLVQGGEAVIARFPVLLPTPDGRPKFWGLISAALDMEKLWQESGLQDPDLAIDVAIAVVRQGQPDAEPFVGHAALLNDNPVSMIMRLGHENWRLSAVPRGGWSSSIADLWGMRLLMILIGFIVIAPMVWTGRLNEERERHLGILRGQEEEMQALSHRLQIALETSKIGIWDYDTSSGVLIWDERMRDLYGLAVPNGLASYADWKNVLHPADVAQAEADFASAIATEKQYHNQFRVLAKNGDIRHIRAIGTTYRDPRGHKKIVGVNWDVTADVRLQEELRQAKRVSDLQNQQLEQARVVMESAAMHDALTGLPNRRYLDSVVAECQQRTGDEASLTVMHLDLDRFKDINDTLGHAAGDQILRHAANTLSSLIYPADFLARIGGDEFVIISAPGNAGRDYVELSGRLIEAISRPILHEGHECRVGTSIGIATRTSADARIEDVLVNADIALYEAKRRGRNRVESFTDALRLEVVNTKRTADEILRGLEQNEFIAYFQPQFDAETLEIVGLEALARWDHPTKGILPPSAFLDIAESLKVVAQIDAVVLNHALLQQFRLNASGFSIPKVSVNISAQRLMDGNLIERLENLSFKPGSLSFELLESISFDDGGHDMVRQIERLKALGVDIEIDDFGSGHASIVALLKLTPRRLKIDRQLVIPLLESRAQQKLVASIIEIGRSRGIEIVAEGVETMAHAAVLRDLGCDTLQGFALAKPMPPSALLSFISERRWLDDQKVIHKA